MTMPTPPAGYALPPALYVGQRTAKAAAPAAIMSCTRCGALVLYPDVVKHDGFHGALDSIRPALKW